MGDSQTSQKLYHRGEALVHCSGYFDACLVVGDIVGICGVLQRWTEWKLEQIDITVLDNLCYLLGQKLGYDWGNPFPNIQGSFWVQQKRLCLQNDNANAIADRFPSVFVGSYYRLNHFKVAAQLAVLQSQHPILLGGPSQLLRHKRWLGCVSTSSLLVRWDGTRENDNATCMGETISNNDDDNLILEFKTQEWSTAKLLPVKNEWKCWLGFVLWGMIQDEFHRWNVTTPELVDYMQKNLPLTNGHIRITFCVETVGLCMLYIRQQIPNPQLQFKNLIMDYEEPYLQEAQNHCRALETALGFVLAIKLLQQLAREYVFGATTFEQDSVRDSMFAKGKGNIPLSPKPLLLHIDPTTCRMGTIASVSRSGLGYSKLLPCFLGSSGIIMPSRSYSPGERVIYAFRGFSSLPRMQIGVRGDKTMGLKYGGVLSHRPRGEPGFWVVIGNVSTRGSKYKSNFGNLKIVIVEFQEDVIVVYISMAHGWSKFELPIYSDFKLEKVKSSLEQIKKRVATNLNSTKYDLKPLHAVLIKTRKQAQQTMEETKPYPRMTPYVILHEEPQESMWSVRMIEGVPDFN